MNIKDKNDFILPELDHVLNILNELRNVEAVKRELLLHGYSKFNVSTFLEKNDIDWKALVERPQNVPCPYTKEQMIDIIYESGCRMCYISRSMNQTEKLIRRWIRDYNIDMNSMISDFSDIEFEYSINNQQELLCRSYLKFNHPPNRLTNLNLCHDNRHLYETNSADDVAIILNTSRAHTTKYHRLMKLEKCALFYVTSKNEAELFSLIKEVYPLTQKKRFYVDKIFHEVDIFIPELNLGIEYNGSYWHSDVYKTNEYHMNKHDAIESLGIQLLSVFEFEYDTRKEELLRYVFSRKFTNIENITITKSKDIIEVRSSNKLLSSIKITYLSNYYLLSDYITYCSNDYLKDMIDFNGTGQYLFFDYRFSTNNVSLENVGFKKINKMTPAIIYSKPKYSVYGAGCNILELNYELNHTI